MEKRYTALRKLSDNRFLNLYEMDAIANDGSSFSYYFASRNKEEDLPLVTGKVPANGIVIYALLKDEPDKIVMIRQYRYPLGDYLYELPAGLIDEGESACEAAARELKEETGFTFVPFEGADKAFERPYFLGAGLTDETSTSVFGYATGNACDKFVEKTECIEVLLVDKTEAKRILLQEKVSIRAAFLLMHFLGSDKEDPYGFLKA